jgi:diguanylate cyclase (GGDEF)-like protein
VTFTWLIGALGVALLVAASAIFAALRARTEARQRMDEAARQTAELRAAVQELQDSVPARAGGELAASLDLEDVIERTLDAAAEIPGVDAAFLEATTVKGEFVRRAVGMPVEEAERTAITLGENDNLRAVELTYRYRLDEVGENGPGAHSGLAVPLRAEGLPVGMLAIFARTRDTLGDAQLEDLERLAFRAGPAVENARRFLEARALADLDALTGLHNRRYFHETLAREVGRAHRYDRRLALLVFDLDDFKAINDKIGHLSGDGVLAEIASRIMSVVRAADVACRVGGDEFGVVLPESAGEDAELLAARIAQAIRAKAVGKAGTLNISAGVAEVREGDDAVELFERADAALYRAKELGKARTVAADGTAGV